jgi:hypothetical protein
MKYDDVSILNQQSVHIKASIPKLWIANPLRASEILQLVRGEKLIGRYFMIYYYLAQEQWYEW